MHSNNGPPGAPGAANGSLPKSTPSSTDDMNSALLKSPTDSGDVAMSNGMFGKFKGFTLRPLNDNASPTNILHATNVAYVQPTVQQESLTVPQRSAPPPPILKSAINSEMIKLNGTLTRPAPAPPSQMDPKPALPPPNPGSQARPLISMPVLENSTISMPMQSMGDGLKREVSPLRPAPPPPVPLHADPKLNIKRDGTIRRIASFLKKDNKDKEEWQPSKEKTYIEREKLRQLEISAPIPVTNTQAESSNSDSETTTITLKEEETKNLVKRTQSMRSPTKKPSIQSFGSMRQNSQAARPKSTAVTAGSAVRPKSPPPRPPPVLKKTNSTTSSGYQLPVGVVKTPIEKAYDDCEFVELPLTSVAEQSPRSSDNIYSVIDEIPPAAKTLKRSDLVASTASDMGLLSEIVSEIEKRNGDSIYSAATIKAKMDGTDAVTSSPTTATATATASASAITATTSNTNTNVVSSYLRPAPLNTPVARVAPTRSDISPTSAFSSFKPQMGGTAKVHTTGTSTVSGGNRLVGGVERNKFINIATPAKSLPSATPSATIQKPKPLSAKPSFNNSARKTVGVAGGVSGKNNAIGTPRTAPTVKTSNIANLTQRFEKGAGDGSGTPSSNSNSMSANMARK